MKTKRTHYLPILALLAFLTAPVLAEDLWLHVRVDEGGESKVTLNLPLNLVEAAMPMIPKSVSARGEIELGDWNVTTQELRQVWNELREGPDMTFVTVSDNGDDVRVWKENNYLHMRASDHGNGSGERVDVRMPLAVIDALLSGSGREFNVQAAVRALVAHGEGELVTVTGDDEHVRVWVDAIAEAD